MNEGFEPDVSAQSASLDKLDQSVHEELQYVSLKMDGRTSGGWYRVLPDGKLELLAFAKIHRERRHESSPIEQARGLLTELVRAEKSARNAGGSGPDNTGNGSAISLEEDRPASAPGTLGALLYADKGATRASENEWAGLVQSIAAGNKLALRELYDRTYRIVFTLIMRLTKNPETAAALTLDVFHGVWLKASEYDAAAGSVVGWVMNKARTRAIDQLMFEQGKERGNGHADSQLSIHAVSSIAQGVAGVSEPTDVLHPSDALWRHLSQRIDPQWVDEGKAPATPQWAEPEWNEVAPGISCKLLATDSAKDRVSMLVRLGPGVEYPPHTHAGVEELHLLHGELLINDNKLYPGDYNRADPHTADTRVWSETGCTCVLITSTRDEIR